MSLESLIKMQSSGARSIEEPNTPRPGGVPQGSVLVVLDVTKETGTAPVYWALGNVVRKGDNIKIVGIVTHISNPMGFKARVEKNSWIGSNGLMLQHELSLKRNTLENIPHVKEWCEKAGVKLELDVKAGYVTKLIIVEEAKAISAYHVVLDKSMKSDRKYFIEHLTCFVSRARKSGGVETIRSFSVTKQLPPLVPTPPNPRVNNNNNNQPTPSSGSIVSRASLGSNFSHHGSASSNSFGVASSDGFLTLDSDSYSGAPTTGESYNDRHHEAQEIMSYRPSLPLRAHSSEAGSLRAYYSELGSQKGYSIPSTPLRQAPAEAETGYNLVNRKPALRKWLAEDEPRGDHEENPSNNGFFADRSNNNGNKISATPVSEQEQTIKRMSPHHLSPRLSPHVSPPASLEKPPNVAALPSQIQSSTGRAFTLVNARSVRTPSQQVTALLPPSKPNKLSPPLSRMPSPPCSKLLQSLHKTVWIWTRSKQVMRSAVEVGWTTFVFTPDTKYMAPKWTSIEWIKPLFLEGGRFLNQESKQVALLGQVYSGEQLDYLPAMMGGTEIVVINDLDWQVIPPEDIVAAFQGRRTQLFATANTAADCQVYLEALEVGTDGVVLHTENVSEIIALRDYLTAKMDEKALVSVEPQELKLQADDELTTTISMARSETSSDRVTSSPGLLHRVGSSPRSDANPLNQIGSSPRLVDSPRHSGHFNSAPQPQLQDSQLVSATVKSIVSVGDGDRVSVDLCNLLNPGEALLVGSFSKGMFLVHSEVQDNNTCRRSFRVNAGPVHAYTGMAGGRITYLSELESGSHVLAVDAHGNQRTVLVGRVSIETKPLVLVQVEAEGASFSVMLQDADSVRLVVPADKQRPGCEAIAVTKLQPGDTVLLRMEDDDCSYEQ